MDKTANKKLPSETGILTLLRELTSVDSDSWHFSHSELGKNNQVPDGCFYLEKGLSLKAGEMDCKTTEYKHYRIEYTSITAGCYPEGVGRGCRKFLKCHE